MVRRRISLSAVALLVLALGAGAAVAKETPSGPKPEATEAMIEQGRGIYFGRCSVCHGLLGDGEGPAAEFMNPRPRVAAAGTPGA